jgi:hypothetical protein
LIPGIYRNIFGRLKGLGIDWVYSFPQTHMIPVPKQEEDQPDYDPSASFEKSEEERREEEMHAKLQKILESFYQKEIEEAKYKPPQKRFKPTAKSTVNGPWPDRRGNRSEHS